MPVPAFRLVPATTPIHTESESLILVGLWWLLGRGSLSRRCSPAVVRWAGGTAGLARGAGVGGTARVSWVGCQ